MRAQRTKPADISKACKEILCEASIGGNFTLKNKKVCSVKKKGDDTVYTALCDPFKVIGRTYDETGDNAALLIRFAADRSTQDIVEVTVPSADLIADPKKVVAELAKKGLWVAAKRESILAVGELLSLIRPKNDVVTVSRPGWYDEVFVSPTGEVFGETDAIYRLSEGIGFADPEPSGDLINWRKATQAALDCANGDFLCIGLLSGFAGPVVNLLQEKTSVLVNFAGTTSRGKTTAQRMGASVYGSPIRDAALVQFNVTPGAVEAIAERANGTLLAIDEGGQSGMTGPQYQTAIFNLAEGSGRRRLTQSAAERKVRKWSTCITISEEIGFADKVKRDGRNAAAGAVARIWEIDVDDAEILGDNVIAAMEGINQNYGHAAPAYMQHLIDEGYPKDIERLRTRIKTAEKALSSEGDSPQKRRVSAAAATLLVSGELAQAAGLIDETYDLNGTVKRVLERSYQRMARDMDPIETALHNLREGMLARIGYDVREIDFDRENVHRAVVAYYGYSEGPTTFTSQCGDCSECERVYFIPVDQMISLAGGNVTAAAIARALKKQGYLITPGGKNSLWPAMPGGEKISHYRVSGVFFHEANTSAALAAE